MKTDFVPVVIVVAAYVYALLVGGLIAASVLGEPLAPETSIRPEPRPTLAPETSIRPEPRPED